ncbi:DUF3263 domain-containing protein [Mycobacterium sp. TY813]|nr:DUF3263 domain-containing protein [Mycobacterium sp. TY813]MDP7729554.1 DUF3263 domain-containing protein [Mycobacterium sp. TY813]
MDSLSDLDEAILAVERQFWKAAGAKEEAIRDQLGMTPIRYYQRLNQLIATAAALAYDPVTVNRLRRITRSG